MILAAINANQLCLHSINQRLTWCNFGLVTLFGSIIDRGLMIRNATSEKYLIKISSTFFADASRGRRCARLRCVWDSMFILIAWHHIRRCDNGEAQETDRIQGTSVVCWRSICQSRERLFVHHQTWPHRSIGHELWAENHRLHQVRRIEAKRIRSRANLVPAVPGSRHAIGPGVDHYV